MGKFFPMLLERAVGAEHVPEIVHTDRLERAHELIESSRFDLVLLDLKLPGSDRDETIAKIPDLAERWQVPIIVTSAFADDPVRVGEDVICGGAHDFITKDRAQKDFRALGEKVDRAICRHRAGWHFIRERNQNGQK